MPSVPTRSVVVLSEPLLHPASMAADSSAAAATRNVRRTELLLRMTDGGALRGQVAQRATRPVGSRGVAIEVSGVAIRTPGARGNDRARRGYGTGRRADGTTPATALRPASPVQPARSLPFAAKIHTVGADGAALSRL
ncbi:hypothetical protein GCM10009608_50840 [Pseudonocardia alaniniphila]